MEFTVVDKLSYELQHLLIILVFQNFCYFKTAQN